MCFPLLPSSYSINVSSCLLCDPACHYCASSKENSFHATEFSTVAEARLWTSELTIKPLWLQSGGSCSGNVPNSQWTGGRCSKGHNHQRTLLPPANMCCHRCSNYLNVQRLRGGVHKLLGSETNLPTSLGGKAQCYLKKRWLPQVICLSFMIVACHIVWYDASEILGKCQDRLYDISCLLCQSAQHQHFPS